MDAKKLLHNYYFRKLTVKALSHNAIFLTTCNAILLSRDVKLANMRLISLHFAEVFFTYQTFFTNQQRVETRCDLQEKLHRVTVPYFDLLFWFIHFSSSLFPNCKK